jgi:hypothetical protein
MRKTYKHVERNKLTRKPLPLPTERKKLHICPKWTLVLAVGVTVVGMAISWELVTHIGCFWSMERILNLTFQAD